MKISEHDIKNKIHFVGIGGIGMSGGNGEEDTKVGLAALQALADHYKGTSYKIEVAADIKK